MNYKDLADRQLKSDTFDKQQLPDITGLSLPSRDAKAKMAAFLQATGNPYLFRVGEICVHVVFSGKPGDALQNHICKLLTNSI